MMKRNDGYALAYVLVVMLILAAIAVAVMTMSLQVLKNQQTSITRMQDKYAAQGLVEQVVAQLERAKTFSDDSPEEIAANTTSPENVNITPGEDFKTITVEVESASAKVIAEMKIEAITKTETTGTTENGDPIETEKVVGHTVVYTSYKTERISTEVNR